MKLPSLTQSTLSACARLTTQRHCTSSLKNPTEPTPPSLTTSTPRSWKHSPSA
uniref:Uncharacterized protein n=1 Tax=Arundo donax TaxID=35708 RepID=A0A0A9H1E0_ARUDO